MNQSNPKAPEPSVDEMFIWYHRDGNAERLTRDQIEYVSERKDWWFKKDQNNKENGE